MKATLLTVLLLIIANTAFAKIRYNEVQQKSSHNSFSHHEAILDQLVFHRIRSIEFDLHRGKIGRSDVTKDWYVYHTPIIDTGTNCDKFSHCLKELQTFDAQVPNHEIVTVWFDMKDGYASGQNPADFDRLIRQYISADDILKPSDLFAACPGAANLKATVSGACKWPTLNNLKGKWMFVVTDAGYGNSGPNRLGFSAEGVDSINDVDSSDRIFFNTGNSNQNITGHVFDKGLIGRRYVLNSQNDFNAAISGKAHHIATDRINYRKDTWSRTHNNLGYPFKCVTQTCNSEREDDNIIGVEVSSDDIWGKNDHFSFQYQFKGSNNGRWISAVNVASSHVERYAKSCLMARQSLSNDSPYFAVCRPSDNGSIAVQYRDDFGSGSGSHNTPITGGQGISQADLTYIKIDTYNNGRCMSGQGSRDGKNWTTITTRCFTNALGYQGLAASSHGDESVKHLFSNPSYAGKIQKRDDFKHNRIGTVRSANNYQGAYPSGTSYYDLGTSSSPVFANYIKVHSGVLVKNGTFGWINNSNLSSRDRGDNSGQNNINRDLNYSSQAKTFEQKVSNGNWYAMITFGDIYLHDKQSVDVEGSRQLTNVSNQPGNYHNRFVASKVTDGAFSLTFSDQGGQDVNWAITRIVTQQFPFNGQVALPN